MSSVLNHVANKILEAPFAFTPWTFVRVENIFPQEYYDDLLHQLPTDDKMEPLGRTTPNRRLYWLLKKGQLQLVDEFWTLFTAMISPMLREVLEMKFEVTSTSMGAELVHDFPGYHLGPHTDANDKLITGLFYLPKDDSAKDHATVLYHCTEPDPLGKGHKFDDVKYRPTYLSQFTPNSALFFERTDYSYHGVCPTKKERWSLAFDLFRR